MGSQRYERLSANDQDDETAVGGDPHHTSVPASPPPSFRSRASSPAAQRLLSSHDPLASEADRTLADTFDDGEAFESDGEDDGDDRQNLIRRIAAQDDMSDGGNAQDVQRPSAPQRTVTTLPNFSQQPALAPAVTGRVNGRGAPFSTFSSANDGVFANLNAKPERGEKTEELPPSYEQAAADATPPYWETTILAPGMVSDEVYVDGLPVGSLFSFVWNGMISMSFQLVGFLLTYLLHTTHAAKNGSRAGLGITLIQYGFYMKGSGSSTPSEPEPQYGEPPEPNSHDFNPDSAAAAVAAMGTSQGGVDGETPGSGISSIASSEWLAYLLMIVGWFILIRAVSDFFRARRHEQLVLQSPDRGLNVPVVAEGEGAETVV